MCLAAEAFPVIGLARLEFDNLAMVELKKIKMIVEKAKRKSKLIALLKDFPDTQAYAEAVGILNSMQGR